MDGTSVIRAVELYRDQYLLSEEFPADVRYYSTESQLPVIQNPKSQTSKELHSSSKEE